LRIFEENRNEVYIDRITNTIMLLLAAGTWRILDERWDSLNHWPVYLYAGVLLFYLLAEKAEYRGSSGKGKQSKKWTRYLLLFFWGLLLIVPVLEYVLYPGYYSNVTVLGAVLAVSGTVLRAWSIWSLSEYFSARIEIKSNHMLVERGPYKFVRHPAYAGNITQAAGIPLILNAYFSLSISAIVLIAFLYRIKFE
jgi:isoprenylcysteine carboxyl methyltransferase (ICMT) family protein YpbQ